MNEILVSYNEEGGAIYTITGENKEDCRDAVYDYFASKPVDISDTEDSDSIVVTPSEIDAEKAKILYANAEKEINRLLAAKNVKIRFNTRDNIIVPKNDALPTRLDSGRLSSRPILSQHRTANTIGTPRQTIETEDFADAPELVKTEITEKITSVLESYANDSNGKYKTEPSNDAPGLPKLIDIKTNQEVITPQKQSNGELAFAVKSPELVSIIKGAFPPEQRFTVKCGSLESAKTIIEQMGGPQNLTFDDNANPKISEFKDQLKATYPDLKFSSDQPSNSNKIKPR